MITATLKLMRPHQWIKNSFVLIGLLYSHQWRNHHLISIALMTLSAFCCLSSAVYIYNDYYDRVADAQHPRKKYRPLVTGQITPRTACGILLGLLLLTMVIGFCLPITVNILLLSYAILNIFYTHWLKYLPIIDIFTIAGGFILRILAGTWAIGIPPSAWLLFCSGMLTLFLGFCKRRASHISSTTDIHQYTTTFLDNAIAITASCCIVSYGLYALNPTTIQIHHTAYLIATEPFVIYGILRYLYHLYHLQSTAAEDTAKAFWQDQHLWLTVGLWLLLTVYLLV